MSQQPRGDRREDIRFAKLASDLRAVWIKGEPEPPERFILRWKSEEQLQPETQALIEGFWS